MSEPFVMKNPEPGDIAKVVSSLRASDKQDIDYIAEDGQRSQIIFDDVRRSDLVMGLYIKNVPCAIFGVIPVGEGIGSPWLVAADFADKHAVGLAKISRKILNFIQRDYPELITWVCEDNKRSIVWHRWSGFCFDGEKVHLGRGVFLRAIRMAE